MTTHDSSETAPSWAMLVGSMMMPDPIMLTATRVVRPVRLIFLLDSAIAESLRYGPGFGGDRCVVPSRLSVWLKLAEVKVLPASYGIGVPFTASRRAQKAWHVAGGLCCSESHC
ncbi:hypothetical protein D9M69_706550 [compost metagenome]